MENENTNGGPRTVADANKFTQKEIDFVAALFQRTTVSLLAPDGADAFNTAQSVLVKMQQNLVKPDELTRAEVLGANA